MALPCSFLYRLIATLSPLLFALYPSIPQKISSFAREYQLTGFSGGSHNTTHGADKNGRQDGEHITFGSPTHSIHAYVIYPSNVSLKSGNGVERLCSEFAIAWTTFSKGKTINGIKKPSEREPEQCTPLGIEMYDFFENPGPKLITVPDDTALITVYDPDKNSKDYRKASLMCPGSDGQDDVTVHTFANLVDLPREKFRSTVATSMAKRSRSTDSPAGPSSSQQTQNQPKPGAGKNATNPSNAQTSNSAAPEKRARLTKGAIGNAGSERLPTASERPSGAKAKPEKGRKHWYWVDYNDVRVAICENKK